MIVEPEAHGKSTEQILGALNGSSVWHFCCHGAFNPIDPLKSSIQYSESGVLTLGDIVEARGVKPPSLVVLSACQTGLHDLEELPHEYLGMPAAFLQRGATSVIATQWDIHDLPTMLLMGEFYRHFVGGKERPASALRLAQLWLRSQSVASAKETMGEWVRDGRITQPQMEMAFKELAEAGFEPDSMPFRDKAIWGGFVAHGS